MIGMKIDNKTVTGAVDDIVLMLGPALTANPRVSPLGGNTKQRAFAKHQSFDIGGTKSMGSA